MTHSSATSRLRRLLQELGPRTSVFYILHRICEKFKVPVNVRSYRLVGQPVAGAPRLPERRRAAYSCRQLTNGDPALDAVPADRVTLDFRFGQGAVCLGLFKQADLAAYLWLTLGDYEEDEVRCRFRPEPQDRTAWDFDVYVMPGHRASFAFAALWDAADDFLRSHGRRWSLSRISAFNLASVRSHSGMGARDIGRADFIGIGPLQLMLSSERPRLHLAFGRGRRPLLRIRAPQ